jgi:hypothetical protein
VISDEIRDEWFAFRREVNAEAAVSKEGQGALFRLFDRYESLSALERSCVDELIAEQVLSPDETDRFDAVALTDKFAIVSAVPALRMLAARLEGETQAGAPYEWAKVNRVIGNLVGTMP